MKIPKEGTFKCMIWYQMMDKESIGVIKGHGLVEDIDQTSEKYRKGRTMIIKIKMYPDELKQVKI